MAPYTSQSAHPAKNDIRDIYHPLFNRYAVDLALQGHNHNYQRTWSLLRKSIHILIEGTPSHMVHEEIKTCILKVRGVTGVFDLHIWTITSGIHALSAHVVVIDNNRSQEILPEINSILEKIFDINHATIQIEPYHESNKI